MIFNVSLAERTLKDKKSKNFVGTKRQGVLVKVIGFLWQDRESSYEPVWPMSNQIHISLHIKISSLAFSTTHYPYDI